MSKKDQILLENIYLKEIAIPDFVINRPHPIDPMEGTPDVNHLGPKQPDQEEQYKTAAQKILDKVLEKDHKVNMSVLKRDNFGNVNCDAYEDAINVMVKYMMTHKDNDLLIHMQAKNIALKLLPVIEKITNRYNYNDKTENSELAAMNNANAKKPHTDKRYVNMEKFNTLSYLGKV
jgi:hypothetical protein